MKISDIITEANEFARAVGKALDASSFKIPTVDIVSQLEPGEYKSNNLKDLKRLVKHKQKQDRKTDRWREDTLTPPEPGQGRKSWAKASIGTKDGPRPQSWGWKNSNFPGKATKEPNAQQSSRLNVAVKDLFAQGMAPPEIEQYLVHELGLKPRIARKLVDQELYAPASRVKRANPYGSEVYTMKKRSQRKQQDDEEISEAPNIVTNLASKTGAGTGDLIKNKIIPTKLGHKIFTNTGTDTLKNVIKKGISDYKTMGPDAFYSKDLLNPGVNIPSNQVPPVDDYAKYINAKYPKTDPTLKYVDKTGWDPVDLRDFDYYDNYINKYKHLGRQRHLDRKYPSKNAKPNQFGVQPHPNNTPYDS